MVIMMLLFDLNATNLNDFSLYLPMVKFFSHLQHEPFYFFHPTHSTLEYDLNSNYMYYVLDMNIQRANIYFNQIVI